MGIRGWELTESTGEEKKAIIVYWSATGNTQKVAEAAVEGLKSVGLNTRISRVGDAFSEELYDYDVVILASPTLVVSSRSFPRICKEEDGGPLFAGRY